MTILDYAYYYLKKGFSVIPLRPNGKKPVIEWAEFQSRFPTEEELFEWFGNGSQNNIGIVTGAISGLDVVDLDSADAVRFAQEHSFPLTPLVKTGEGIHLYYRHKEGVRNFQKRDDLPGIDLRGDGGYIVAPPSVHESGKRYHWCFGSIDDHRVRVWII